VYAVTDVVAVGAIAYVSQLIGAGERARAGVAAFQALRGALLLGVPAVIAGLFFARPIFQLMGAPEVVDSGAAYLGPLLVAAPLPMIAFTCEGILRAGGDTRTPLKADLFSILLNAALDPLLIYGFGPFPRLGVAGAAWATVIAQAALVIVYLVLARRGHPAFPLARRAPGPPVRIAGLLKVGAPVALIGMLFSVVYVAFARAAAAYGAAAMAVVGVSNRIEAIQFITAYSIGSAGAAIVGQALGAGRPDRAMDAIRTGVRWSLWLSLGWTVVLLAAPGPFLALFSADPEVMRLGVPYLRILTLCLMVNAVEIVCAEAVLGSGHTRVVSALFTAFSLLRIPLAFVVPSWGGLGVVGIAWIITVTCLVRGVLIAGWVFRGTWRRGLGGELATDVTASGAPPSA
jgi:putative MATE family efflux protein